MASWSRRWILCFDRHGGFDQFLNCQVALVKITAVFLAITSWKMGEVGGGAPDECNIKVVCRIRPLNETEEKAGSKFVLKFPTDDSVSLGVSSHRAISCCTVYYWFSLKIHKVTLHIPLYIASAIKLVKMGCVLAHGLGEMLLFLFEWEVKFCRRHTTLCWVMSWIIINIEYANDF